MLAVQQFMPTAFDWRVGVVNHEIIYLCKYMIPKGKWKHGAKLRGKPSAFVWGRTVPLDKNRAPVELRKVALKACEVVGDSFYGIDIKEINGKYVVVEINDNPSVYAGHEDYVNGDLYEKVIACLAS